MSNIFNLADMVVRINVGYRSYDKAVSVNYTKMALNVSSILYKQGFISSFRIKENTIIVTLKYLRGGKPLLKNIKLVSKPSKRVYWSRLRLGLVYNSKSIAGIYVVSTRFGLLTSTECLLNKNTGGEVLLKITLT